MVKAMKGLNAELCRGIVQIFCVEHAPQCTIHKLYLVLGTRQITTLCLISITAEKTQIGTQKLRCMALIIECFS